MSDSETRISRPQGPSQGRPDGHDAGTAEPRLRLIQARSILLCERLLPALWAPMSVLGLFAAFALSGLSSRLPGWLHAAVLLAFAVAVAAALVLGFRRFALPGEDEARRRLERDSGIPHRPLHTLRDRPAGGDPMAEALWSLHQERVRAAMRRLRLTAPRSDVPSHDRYALRGLVTLVLLVVGAAGWGDWGPRISAAFSPRFDGGTATVAATLDLWVTPPDYTGLPPVFLKTGGNQTGGGQTGPRPDPAAQAPPVAVPKGSLVLARVTGGRGAPTLEAGDKSAAFETVDPSTFQIQQPILAGNRIAVSQNGQSLGSWPVRVVPDAPPTVAHTAPPAKAERGALKLDYTARDDYGLAEVKAVIQLGTDDEVAEVLGKAPLDLPLALPGLRPKEAHNVAFHDQTAHPWAGLPVIVRLVATDGAGQTGVSEDAAITLPERNFSHPVARAIVQQRKRLTLRPKEGRIEAARALAEISARPGTYGGDIVVFLSLRTAIGRLILDKDAAAVPAVQQLLWETALRIEDGGVSQAERDLRNAEQRLSEALERGATDEELRRLMDELQQALNQFMAAMEQQMMEALKRGEQIPMVPPELADRMMNRNDLQEMMDRMRQMAETGSRDAARQMLSQLQQMLENLRNGAMAQMQPQQGGQQNQAWEMMRQLQDLARQQQQLLDQSFRQSQDQMQQDGQQRPRGRQPGQQNRQQQQQGQGNMQGSPTLQKQAEQQEALRRQLGELMRQLGEMNGGEIPRPLGRAERAMRDAGQALQQGSPGAAVPPQTQAMDELQQGLQSMAEQLANQMAMGQGQGMAAQPQGQPGRPNRNRDPLGRRPSGFGTQDANDVKIPEQSDLQRAREILDELRRRSGQFNRPQPERDYIDRLLKQF